MKKIVLLIAISFFCALIAGELSADELRLLAKKSGLQSTPKTFEQLQILSKKNTLTPQKINLGRMLFFEPLLSRDETLTCATCHKLSQGGDDNLPTAIGFEKRVNPKHLNSPTVLNASLSTFLFWDGRSLSVEEQAGGPIQAHFEMNVTPEELVRRLEKNTMYQEAFRSTFADGISFENVKKAIGAFERILLTRGKFDDFLDGNDKALNFKAKRGLKLFIQKGCAKCHYGIALGGQAMKKFPKYGVSFPFANKGGFQGKDNKQIIRVPLLRNITKTAPYYHNGSIKNLADVIKIESQFNANKKITKKEISNIIEFLRTLDGNIVDYNIGG